MSGDRPYPRQLKHLAIIGSSNIGKTRFTSSLVRVIPTALHCDDSGFMDWLYDGAELIVFNEFFGNKMSYSFWKQFTDSSPIMLKMKGSPPKYWDKVIPMVFTANRHPTEWWTFTEQDCLDSRLLIVEVPPGQQLPVFEDFYE